MMIYIDHHIERQTATEKKHKGRKKERKETGLLQPHGQKTTTKNQPRRN